MHTPFISPVITSKSIDDGMYVLTTTEFSRFMLPSLKADKSMMLSFINDFPVPKKIPVPKVRQLNNIYKLGNVTAGIVIKF